MCRGCRDSVRCGWEAGTYIGKFASWLTRAFKSNADRKWGKGFDCGLGSGQDSGFGYEIGMIDDDDGPGNENAIDGLYGRAWRVCWSDDCLQPVQWYGPCVGVCHCCDRHGRCCGPSKIGNENENENVECDERIERNASWRILVPTARVGVASP